MTKKRVKDGYLEIFLEDTESWIPVIALVQHEQGLSVSLEENQQELLSGIISAIESLKETNTEGSSSLLQHEAIVNYPGNNSWSYTPAYKIWSDKLKAPYVYARSNILDINNGFAKTRLEFALKENGFWLPQQGFDTNPDTGEVVNKEIYRNINLSSPGVSPSSFCAEKAQGNFVRIGFKSEKTFRVNIQIWSAE